VSLILNDKEYLFEGICEGHISEDQKGLQGFGYDPIFIPTGAAISFAEMTMEEKTKYSHRQKAVAKLIAFFKLSKGFDTTIFSFLFYVPMCLVFFQHIGT
jgi:XTP/dITP diphosphohydrolase